MKEWKIMILGVIGVPLLWLSIYALSFNILHGVYDVVDKTYDHGGIEVVAGLLASFSVGLCITLFVHTFKEKP